MHANLKAIEKLCYFLEDWEKEEDLMKENFENAYVKLSLYLNVRIVIIIILLALLGVVSFSNILLVKLSKFYVSITIKYYNLL